jgi:AraC-like DNA-binding protein
VPDEPATPWSGPEPADWADAQRLVSREYFPHVLRPLRAGTLPHLRFCTIELGPLTVAHIDWGADVSVATEHAGAYGINVPVSGHMEATLDGDHADVEPGHATVHPPDTPTMIRRWTADCANLGVKIDQAYLDRELVRVFGRPGLRLPFHVDLTSAAGQGWLDFVRTMATQVRRNPAAYANRIAAEQLAGSITTMFALAALPEQADEGALMRPRTVNRVLDAVHADPARPWTTAQMAEVAGVGVRRLQEGFREHLGVTPREFLRDVRLDRVREELTADDATSSVTDVALRWGFTHTGRFAADYRRRFGVSPSADLGHRSRRA